MYSQYILKNQRYLVFIVAFVFIAALIISIGKESSYWFEYWWMFPIAFLIALTVNTAGISGAALFVPFFILIFPIFSGTHLAPVDTVKLGLITESFGLSSSALAFFAFGLIDTTLARKTILHALPFVLLGVLLVFLIPKSTLYAIIAILLLLAVILLRYEHVLKQKRTEQLQSNHICAEISEGEHVKLISKDKKTYEYCRSKSGAKKRFLGYSIGGIFQGAAGFGIGEIGIITMMLTHIPTRIAIGTSHFIVAGTAIIASLAHFLFSSTSITHPFPWNIPVMTIPAVILGGQLAPYIAAKLPIKYLERFVSGLFIIIAIALIILAFSSST